MIPPLMAPHPDGHTHEPAATASLRDGGKRLTVQRALIWEILTARPDAHLSADEIAEEVRARMPQVNASTVYRNLEMLVENGLVLRTNLGESRTFFEPAHSHRHHHLVCEQCGKVEHVHGEILGGAPARIRTRHGFQLGTRELTLFGRCRDCINAAGDASDPSPAVQAQGAHSSPPTSQPTRQ